MPYRADATNPENHLALEFPECSLSDSSACGGSSATTECSMSVTESSSDKESMQDLYEPLGINDLPLEILEQIFGLLPNLCDRHQYQIRGVCRIWDLILSDDRWRIDWRECENVLCTVPLEIYEAIFRFLPPAERQKLKLVSKQWKSVLDIMAHRRR